MNMERLAQVFVTANEYVCTMSTSCCQTMNLPDAVVQVKVSVVKCCFCMHVCACMQMFCWGSETRGRKCNKSDTSSGPYVLYLHTAVLAD